VVEDEWSGQSSIRFRLGAKEPRTLLWLRLGGTLIALLLFVGFLGGGRLSLVVLAALMLLLNLGQVVMSRVWVRIDADGVHFPFRPLGWDDVSAVRSSKGEDCVVLQLHEGRERRLGLAASESERVASVAGKKLLP